MNNLLPLATLMKFTETHLREVLSLGCYFKTVRFVPEEKRRITVDEWLVSLAPFGPYRYRSEAPLLTDACSNMIDMLLEKDFVIPTINLEDTIIHSNQTESLILQFEKIIQENGSLTFSFKYWPKTSLEDNPPWQAALTEGSHWDSTIIAKVYGNSLYEVCTQLMEEYEKDQRG